MGKEEEKLREDEYKKNPMANFSDSINRSLSGDLNSLAKGGIVSRIITTIVVIILLVLLFYL